MNWPAAAAALTALLLAPVALFAAKEQPNVVLIISDDHGWSDYGFMNHPHVQTPNIDRLAREGLTLTRGYVPTSLCRPSLASIMTGLYPHQHRITGNDPKGNAKDAAARAEMVRIFQKSKTIAAQLGMAGYVSHQSGKWWEGECKCGGFTECMTHGDVERGGRHGDEGLKIGRQTMQPVFDFIDRAGVKPFFLWYAPFLPHQPHNPPERLLAKYRLRTGLTLPQAKYYAMIEWLDETVGQLVQHLEKRGKAANTIIAYVADNGWIQLDDNRPFHQSRSKLSPYDAGLRTPIIIWQPGRIKPERDERNLASTIDLATTLLPAAGIKAPKEMPGIDLRSGRERSRRKSVFGAIFLHTSEDVQRPESSLKYRWVISEQWKLVVPHAPNAALDLWPGSKNIGWMKPQTELFQIAKDPSEQTDAATANPAVAARLLEELDKWWPVK